MVFGDLLNSLSIYTATLIIIPAGALVIVTTIMFTLMLEILIVIGITLFLLQQKYKAALRLRRGSTPCPFLPD